MIMKTLFVAIGALSCVASPAIAQQAASKPAPAATATPKAAAAVVHSPQSIECSKEADAKGLHGKARKAFRSQCKDAATKK